MYFIKNTDYDFQSFDTIEKAEEYAILAASRYGHGYCAAICKVEKFVATNEAQVQYAELTAEEYQKKVEDRKQKLISLGINPLNED